MEKHLRAIILRQCLDNNLVVSDTKINKIIDKVMLEARGLALSNRKITVTNDKLKRDAKRVSATGRSNGVLFGKILTMLRQKAKHRGVISPKVGSEEFLVQKEVARLADEFCNEFNLPPNRGYGIYIGIALPKMKNYSIHKFKNLHAAVIKEYEANEKIRMDSNPQHTQLAHKIYNGIVSDKVGMFNDYRKNPEKYSYFVDVVNESRAMGIKLEDYIKAQFYALEWCNGIPEPSQLVGEKSRERVIKYCYEKDIKLNEKTTKINFKLIKESRG